jgi:hypothetical protein
MKNISGQDVYDFNINILMNVDYEETKYQLPTLSYGQWLQIKEWMSIRR